jgi:hypothetical protein
LLRAYTQVVEVEVDYTDCVSATGTVCANQIADPNTIGQVTTPCQCQVTVDVPQDIDGQVCGTCHFFLLLVKVLDLGKFPRLHASYILLGFDSALELLLYTHCDGFLVGSGKHDTPGPTLTSPILRLGSQVYLYYKLQRFYQNHRRYVKSRDDSQLHGRDTPVQSVCDPLATTADGQAYAPCGFIANSMFNGMCWMGSGRIHGLYS